MKRTNKQTKEKKEEKQMHRVWSCCSAPVQQISFILIKQNEANKSKPKQEVSDNEDKKKARLYTNRLRHNETAKESE